MLSYPDRHKFEEIRARWETAQPAEDDASNMVGRREKQASQQQLANSDSHPNGGSKFRRTLSHGLAFISNPLSQRKITPARRQVKEPSLAVSESVTAEEATGVSACDAPLSPVRKATSFERSNGSPTKSTAATDQSPTKNVDTDATPRPPRSHTISFIPRPVRVESGSFAIDIDGPVKPHTPAVMTDPTARNTPSKIPTPSPPLSQRCGSSPRQYLPHHTPQQTKHIGAAYAFSGKRNGSPARVAIRSRTTPNLVKVANSPQPGSSMTPKRTMVKRPTASPKAQKLVLQENVPTNKRVPQRRSQIQEKSFRTESLAVPGTISNRRSFGQGAPLRQRKEPSFATPPAVQKRLSSYLAHQTPVTAKRVQSREQVKPHAPDASHIAGSSAIMQPRLMGPRNPPTPTPSTTDPSKPALPRSSTDKDLQRKTLGTPNGLGGVWRSSRALAVTNHEVRRLPRSHTFHTFGTQWEALPPVPPIPEQYRTPSLSNLIQDLQMSPGTPVKPRPVRMVSDVPSYDSIPEETSEEGYSHSADCTPSRPGQERFCAVEISNSTDSLTALPRVPPTLRSLVIQSSTSAEDCESGGSGSQNSRPWAISDRYCPESADVDPLLQVKDYMPPLYWAGRFQSRFDQWRTEAMMTELNPNHRATGPLGECKLNQEKVAACYIFAQLRDLCTSNQAADSLWEFEFKYRKDHKLLGNSHDLAIVASRKHDDQSTQKGAFGRAVRKLTPRKSSFVNLLKGKGWNKGEEKPNDESEQNLETSSSSS